MNPFNQLTSEILTFKIYSEIEANAETNPSINEIPLVEIKVRGEKENYFTTPKYEFISFTILDNKGSPSFYSSSYSSSYPSAYPSNYSYSSSWANIKAFCTTFGYIPASVSIKVADLKPDIDYSNQEEVWKIYLDNLVKKNKHLFNYTEVKPVNKKNKKNQFTNPNNQYTNYFQRQKRLQDFGANAGIVFVVVFSLTAIWRTGVYGYSLYSGRISNAMSLIAGADAQCENWTEFGSEVQQCFQPGDTQDTIYISSFNPLSDGSFSIEEYTPLGYAAWVRQNKVCEMINII